MREVKAGAAFLDVRVPDWVDRLNLDTLDMASGACCVLGQLEGERREETSSFGAAVLRLFGGSYVAPEVSQTVAALGFNSGPTVFGVDHYEMCQRLTAAWKN